MKLNNNKSLTKMAGIIMLGRIVASCITFVMPIIMVRLFNRDEFGLYKQIFLVATTFVPILAFGLSQNVYYFFPRAQDKQKSVILNILLIHFIIGIFVISLFSCYPSIIAFLFKGNEIVTFIPWIGVYIFLSLISSIFENVAVANAEIKISSLIIVLSDLVRVIFVISAAVISKDLMVVLLVAIVYSLLRLIAFLVYVSKRFKQSYTFEFNLIKKQFLYSLPYGMGQMLYCLRMQLHNFFIVFLFEPQMFAIYSVGIFQLPVLYIVKRSVGTILTSEFSKLQYKESIDDIKAIYLSSVRKLSFCFFPLFCFFFIIKREFIILLFTADYVDSIPILAVNLVNILFAVFIVDPVFRAFPNYQSYRLKVSLILFIFLFIALYFFGKKFGMLGVVSTNLIVLALLQIILFAKSLRIISCSKVDIILMIRQIFMVFLVSAISCLPLIVVKLLIPTIDLLTLLIIETILYLIVYALLVYVLNLITDKEKQAIYNYLLNRCKRLKLSFKTKKP